MEEYTFEFEGKSYSSEELQDQDTFRTSKNRVLALGFDDKDQRSVQAFRSAKEFQTWTQETRHGETVAKALRRKEALLERRAEAREEFMTLHKNEHRRMKDDMERLASETGLACPSEELFKKAHDAGMIKTLILCDGPDYAPPYQVLGASSFAPDFGWMGFNDRTSSLLLSGMCTLHEHIWFQGSAFWWYAVPGWGLPNLANFGWDNVASSAWAVGP